MATELLGFQAVWLAYAFGAAAGLWSVGVVAAAAFVVWQLLARRYDRRRLFAALMLMAFAGLVCENVFAVNGLVSHASLSPAVGYVPVWLLALLAAFGCTQPTTVGLLGQAPIAKAAVLGMAFGPLAYWAGARIGGLVLALPDWRSPLVVSVVWGMVRPTLVRCTSSLGPAGRGVPRV